MLSLIITVTASSVWVENAIGTTLAPSVDEATSRRVLAEALAHFKEPLLMPIDNVDPSTVKEHFLLKRGDHLHEAVDISAPRNTPVRAVSDGKIARLFNSKPGGITIYQLDASGKYVFYYAHLERYADKLEKGKVVKKGDVIGYVGTSGNAPPNHPHLHFSISLIENPSRYWTGIPIDPYELFKIR